MTWTAFAILAMFYLLKYRNGKQGLKERGLNLFGGFGQYKSVKILTGNQGIGSSTGGGKDLELLRTWDNLGLETPWDLGHIAEL